MFTSETNIRVRYAETDQMNVVYHSNFFLYFEVARAESIRKLGYTYADMEKMGIIMPVVNAEAKFLRPALYDDLLTIKTYLKELPHDHRITFHHEVFNEEQKLLCVGHISLYFLEKHTRKRTVMPDVLLEKLKSYF